MIVDWISIIMFIIDIVICLINKTDVINSKTQVSAVLRSIKIIRILKIIYFSKTWFRFEKTILKMFVETLNTVKFFLVLLLCITLIFAFVGQSLFAYRAKFDHTTHLPDLKHGTSYVTNFDTLYKSIIAVILLI